MRFTNGFWLMRPGVDARYAREAYDLQAEDGGTSYKDWSETSTGLLGQNPMTSLDECNKALAAANDQYGVMATMVQFALLMFIACHEFGHVVIHENRNRGREVPFEEFARA